MKTTASTRVDPEPLLGEKVWPISLIADKERRLNQGRIREGDEEYVHHYEPQFVNILRKPNLCRTFLNNCRQNVVRDTDRHTCDHFVSFELAISFTKTARSVGCEISCAKTLVNPCHCLPFFKLAVLFCPIIVGLRVVTEHLIDVRALIIVSVCGRNPSHPHKLKVDQ